MRGLFSSEVREATSKHDGMDFVRNGAWLLEALISSCQGNTNPIRIFSANELAAATDNYHEDRFVGLGLSVVYWGTEEGQSFAVKIFINGDFDMFINEAISLSQVNHKNVVRLLGCCIETQVPILVYEFLSNGTLRDHFFTTGPSLGMPWATRLRIATEVADALSYLHIALSRPIVHRNIKSSSILLDEHYSAKIGTFGFSAFITGEEKQPADPLYDSMQHLSAKSGDVYDFGVVLIELITGKELREIVHTNDRIVPRKRTLVDQFVSSVGVNLHNVLETGIIQEGEREQLVACTMLARKCVQANEEERPTMKEVVQELRQIKRFTLSCTVYLLINLICDLGFS
ncbi:putative Wall-associated receptor kinase-like 8 [Cocos nucifera]|uniref:Putative Wall-associated receptor kinase-like 8 n=1 Tax=Cocos nucifera TaxID=13894 RepID=A0A8K0N8Q9_COCNU|nr:putative Wall-associated receptor kinase-like 8 [Cocos nucifera]